MRKRDREDGEGKGQGSEKLKRTARKRGLRGKREAISIWEYELPGASETALKKNIRAGARKRKQNATRGSLAIVCNQSQGQRDPGSGQERTSSYKDQMGAERSNLLSGCSEWGRESLNTNSLLAQIRHALMALPS